MEKMNLCFISREFPPQSHTGGIGTYAHIAAALLAERGHLVHVITVSPQGTREDLLENGVHVHRIPMHPLLLRGQKWMYPYRVLFRKLFFPFLECQAWSFGASLELDRILRQMPLDAVEYPETGAEGFYPAHKADPARVCRLHIGSVTEAASNLRGSVLSRLRLQNIERYSILRAHRVTCPSRFLAGLSARALGMNPDSISVFPNPLDSLFTESPLPGPEPFGQRLLFVGRLERRKGIEILLSAFINLLDRFPQSRLRLVGQDYGYYYDPIRKTDRLRDLLKRYGVTDSVEFVPRVQRQDLLAHFAWADAVAVPSINENLPYVVLEAMARGKCVIASDCGGIPEMIESGKNGFLFPTGDISGMTASLVTAWENPERLAEIGRRARLHVQERYSAKAVAGNLESAYQEAIVRRRKG